jgi:hypothetical protein
MSTKQIISFVLLTLAEFSISSAQPAQYDVFPLKPGLQYKYVYHYGYEQYLVTFLEVLESDSGLVVCTIKDSVLVGDTAREWSVEERRTLWHRRFYYQADTSYWTDTTTSGKLIENLAGNHAVSCSLLVWSFPLQYPLKDVYRYADSAEVLLAKPYFSPRIHNPLTGYDSLWFSSSRGFYQQSRLDYLFLTGNYYDHLNVELLGNPTIVQENSFGLPTNFLLFQNYPNPFNPSTTIKYELPKSSEVRLSIFDLLGREVSVLVNERRDAGVYDVKFDGSGLSSGVYFYRLQAGDFVQTRKLCLVR